MQETPVGFLGQEDPLEKGQTTHPVLLGFPGGSGGKESTCNARNLGLIPGLGTKQQRPLKGLHVRVIMLWNLHLN